jgi:hypothetical protein
VKDGVLECHWESASGRCKAVQIVVLLRKVREVLAELHGGSLGGNVGVSKTVD